MGGQAGCPAKYRPNNLNFPALLLQTTDTAPLHYTSPSPAEHCTGSGDVLEVLRIPTSPGRDGHLLEALSGHEASEILEDSGN